MLLFTLLCTLHLHFEWSQQKYENTLYHCWPFSTNQRPGYRCDIMHITHIKRCVDMPRLNEQTTQHGEKKHSNKS